MLKSQDMATKVSCDGCGKEIPPLGAEGPTFGDGDGRSRKARLQLGVHCVEWDLCDGCLGAAAEALAGALPSKSRAEWISIVRPSPVAKTVADQNGSGG